jgi:hypothetical protein
MTSYQPGESIQVDSNWLRLPTGARIGRLVVVDASPAWIEATFAAVPSFSCALPQPLQREGSVMYQVQLTSGPLAGITAYVDSESVRRPLDQLDVL